VPWQLFGYGRSDWSTKLIRGLTSEAAAGFRSRRGLSYDDSAPVTPHNAPFPTYKTAEQQAYLTNLHALKRIASPDELAQAALYLASDASSFQSGTAMLVDGGLSITRT